MITELILIQARWMALSGSRQIDPFQKWVCVNLQGLWLRQQGQARSLEGWSMKAVGDKKYSQKMTKHGSPSIHCGVGWQLLLDKSLDAAEQGHFFYAPTWASQRTGGVQLSYFRDYGQVFVTISVATVFYKEEVQPGKITKYSAKLPSV